MLKDNEVMPTCCIIFAYGVLGGREEEGRVFPQAVIIKPNIVLLTILKYPNISLEKEGRGINFSKSPLANFMTIIECILLRKFW